MSISSETGHRARVELKAFGPARPKKKAAGLQPALARMY